jgi:hypothetical protein
MLERAAGRHASVLGDAIGERVMCSTSGCAISIY